MPAVDGASEDDQGGKRAPLSLIDLGFLSEEERKKILDVLKRDEELRKAEEVRVKKLKTELHELRKKAAVNPDDETSTTNGCARCHEEFGLFSSGNQCPKCKHHVCPKCQVFTPTGKRWLCVVCHKAMQIKIESGEWFYEKLEVAEKVTLFGSDLVKASLAKAKADPSNPPKLTIDDLRPSSSAESTPRTKHRVRHRRTNSNPKDLRNYRHADSASDRDSGWSQHNGASLDASESSQRSSLHDDESHQRSSSIHSSTGSEHVNSDSEAEETTEASTGFKFTRVSVKKVPSTPTREVYGTSLEPTIEEQDHLVPAASAAPEASHVPHTPQRSRAGSGQRSRTGSTHGLSPARSRAGSTLEADGATNLTGNEGVSADEVDARLKLEVEKGPEILVQEIQPTPETDDPDEDIDRYLASTSNATGNSTLGASRNLSLTPSSAHGGSSTSLTSLYSEAGECYGKFPITGDIQFSMNYNYKIGLFEIKIINCRDLAPIDTKKNKSDPYVKTYLLPDKTKNGKRKTRVKKGTINPMFEETIKYTISQSELQTRTLNVSVWHRDAFGRNTFLGEVLMPLDSVGLDSYKPTWHTLCNKSPPHESSLSYKGDLLVALRFEPVALEAQESTDADAPPSPEKSKAKKRSKRKGDSPTRRQTGWLHVNVKEGKNLMAVRMNGSSNPFVKCYLEPDRSKQGKRKTNVVKNNLNPSWNHQLSFGNVTLKSLKERCLELTVWDYDTIGSNDFLGGIRLGMGTGQSFGKKVDWMDSTMEEKRAWQNMIRTPGEWSEATLTLRPNMNTKSAT